jgi:DnaJ family protein B protein 12
MKRQTYDSYGHDKAEQINQQGGGGHPFAHGFHGGNAHEINPEEIFNMFFNGMAGGPQVFRTQFGGGPQFQFGGGPQFRGRQQQGRHREERTSSSFLNQLFQLMPVLIMVLMSMSSFGNTRPPAEYKLQPEGMYQLQKQAVSHRCPEFFYVKDDKFDHRFPRNSRSRKNLENEVLHEYKAWVHEECKREKRRKNTKLYQARMSTDQTRFEKASKEPTPSCDNYERCFGWY